jgi:hypothetical protein
MPGAIGMKGSKGIAGVTGTKVKEQRSFVI